MTRSLNYRILLRREPEGGYTVTVPTLPGCVTFGETVEEAITMAREATEVYIEDLRKRERRFPAKKDCWNTPSPSKPMPEIPAPTPQIVINILEKKGLC